MNRRFVVVLGGVLILALVAVGLPGLTGKVAPLFSSTGASLDGPRAASSTGRSEAARAPAAPADAAGGAQVAGQAVAQVLPSLDRLIIRTVTLSLVVPDVQEVYGQVERIAAEQGGLISGSQVRQEGDYVTATITVRVPADAATYARTMERLRGLAERVVDEQVQTQDVSEEYVDLESRLRNLRMAEDRLLALYDKAQRLEEVFAVQREITTVRGQIEQAQGRKQAIERRAAMATINLQLRETGAAPRPRAQADWSPFRVAGEAVGALATVLRGLTTAAIWVAIWLPLYGLPLLALWLFRRRVGALVRTLTQ
jgi:Domain of unknown function (DUF4349)